MNRMNRPGMLTTLTALTMPLFFAGCTAAPLKSERALATQSTLELRVYGKSDEEYHEQVKFDVGESVLDLSLEALKTDEDSSIQSTETSLGTYIPSMYNLAEKTDAGKKYGWCFAVNNERFTGIGGE